MLKITSNYPQATGVLDKYKRYVVQQTKSNLTKGGHRASGDLYGSVKGYIQKKFNRGLKGRLTGGSTMPSLSFEMLDYGKYVDEGVKGSKSSYMKNAKSPYKFGRGTDKKAVPVEPIKKWLAAKGMDKSLAFVISRSIYQKGIERSMFFLKPFKKRLAPMLNSYHNAVANDIAINIANRIQKKMRSKLNKI